MTDLSLTVAPKSDQLNADDLISGPRTITITGVSANPDSAEQPVSVYFDGDNGKPYKPCKSMRRVMIAAWGPNGLEYVGRRMTLYRDDKVKFGGMEVGGIRISHMSNIDRKLNLALTVTKARRAPYTVTPLADTPKVDAEAISKAAMIEAKKGTDAFRAHWSTLDKFSREVIKPKMADYQKAAKDADTISNQTEEDPFGLPPIQDPIVETIRGNLDDGADPASCRTMYADEIAAAGDTTKVAIDALFAEYETE